MAKKTYSIPSPPKIKPIVTQSPINVKQYYHTVTFTGLSTSAPPKYVRKKNAKPVRKHLKYRVQEKGWSKFDDWWIGPEQPLSKWEKQSYKEKDKMRLRLGHACKDGKVRCPGALYINPRGRKGCVVSAKCTGCKAPLGKKVQFLLQLHFAKIGSI